jgi:flavin reductase (DIM6/NTAB) family NADH-FMN oxidoreductase RutF
MSRYRVQSPCSAAGPGFSGRPDVRTNERCGRRTAHRPRSEPLTARAITGPAVAADSELPSQELFREVFGRFATGVAVITSAGPGGAGGMTANALCSLSLDPLLVLVCFENDARTLPIVRESGRFAVNVLSAQQEELAGVFASKLPEAEKLQGASHRLRDGLPVLEGTLAWAVCQLTELISGGDHTIAIGRVTSMGLGAGHPGQPLVWFGGRYHAWEAPTGNGLREPSGRPGEAGPRPPAGPGPSPQPPA